jgi:acyl-CoA thioesterase YciA
MRDRGRPSRRTQCDEEPGEAMNQTELAARQPAIRVLMMPKDTNAMGTIFGGIILSYIDQAGAVPAHQAVGGRIVTVALHEVVFHEPVFVGDLVSFYAEVTRIGTTSVTVHVTVESERPGRAARRVKVTEADVVYVHVDAQNHPLAIPRTAAEAAR